MTLWYYESRIKILGEGDVKRMNSLTIITTLLFVAVLYLLFLNWQKNNGIERLVHLLHLSQTTLLSLSFGILQQKDEVVENICEHAGGGASYVCNLRFPEEDLGLKTVNAIQNVLKEGALLQVEIKIRGYNGAKDALACMDKNIDTSDELMSYVTQK